MGSCMSAGSDGDDYDVQRSRELDKLLKEDEKRARKHIKLLLLGAGASGKSTVLKQMRLIHNVTFTEEEIEDYRQLVFDNIVNGMKLIIDAMDEWEISVEPSNRKFIALVDNPPDIQEGQVFPAEYREPLERLWKDRGVQHACARGNEYALPENLPYFYSQLDRLWRSDFKPSHQASRRLSHGTTAANNLCSQDILRIRVKTTGISETKFTENDLTYSLFDVGGQRSERRKWVSCFENVTAVLFLVALSGYNATLVEDKDSILFLNKDDVFRQQLEDPNSQIADYFPDFNGPTGPAGYEAGREYFKAQFVGLNRSSSKEVYTHFTNATDTAMLKVVMAAVQE
ncbi:hypothetical protein NliqN6_6446 [Naganishia liquefaciens]|uniref:Uncharacterized protein n=1 Tax=Naganishia liquefaciens TaxID=104408 RepID=A0A8H3TZN2_9TREE|nr:hypothetical protein NliqN6_6446 [Naganishia liquefaciens]